MCVDEREINKNLKRCEHLMAIMNLEMSSSQVFTMN